MARERTIPLHQNESYWLVTDEIAALYSTSNTRHFSTYPDYTELRQLLATYAGTGTHEVLATPGSDAAIRALAEELKRTGKRALLPVPTFYGYERIFKQVDFAVDTVLYKERDGEFVFPAEEVLAYIDQGIDALFLCSPNNPLGSAILKEDIENILDACKERNVLAVVDEAYFEFGDNTAVNRIESQPIYIIRTLSKAFGLAGARVGYVLANEKLINTLRERQLPWGIAHPSLYAATQALKNARQILKGIELIHDARGEFAKELSNISGVRAYDSCTNFVLARVPNATALRGMLEKKRIFIARGETMSYVPECATLLKNTVRMSVPSPKDREYVLDAIRAAL